MDGLFVGILARRQEVETMRLQAISDIAESRTALDRAVARLADIGSILEHLDEIEAEVVGERFAALVLTVGID